jgi:hypothetical protein
LGRLPTAFEDMVATGNTRLSKMLSAYADEIVEHHIIRIIKHFEGYD